MTFTKNQKSRLEADWSRMAGEPVEVDDSNKGAIIYGFASELGVLRIFAKYNTNGAYPNEKVRVGFGQNLNKWYVSLDTF